MTASYASLLAGTSRPGLFSWRGRPDRDLAGEARMAGWQAMSLDTRGIGSMGDFFADVIVAWGLPDWFGCNLDALFDVLSEQAAAMPTILIWDGLRDLVALDPIRADGVLDVVRDAVEQSDHLAVIVRDDLGVSGFDALL